MFKLFRKADVGTLKGLSFMIAIAQGSSLDHVSFQDQLFIVTLDNIKILVFIFANNGLCAMDSPRNISLLLFAYFFSSFFRFVLRVNRFLQKNVSLQFQFLVQVYRLRLLLLESSFKFSLRLDRIGNFESFFWLQHNHQQKS